MADREETLLFIVDIQVKNASAIAALDAEMAALDRERARRTIFLADSAVESAEGHQALADAMERVNGASRAMPGSNTGNGNNYSVGPARGGASPASETQIVGIRGTKNPGSRQNPIGMGGETAAASGLGGMGIGGTPAGASSSSSSSAPVAAPAPSLPSSDDKHWLTAAAETVAAATKATTPAPPPASSTEKSALTAAAEDVASRVASSTDDRVISSLRSASGMRHTLGAPPAWEDLADHIYGPTVAKPATLTAAETAGRLGVSTTAARDLAATGRLPGARKESGAWVIPEESVTAAAGGAGGSGGGKPPPVAYGSPGVPGGGGRRRGSRIMWTPGGGTRSEPDSGDSPFSLANLFRGDEGRGGAFGLPGFGSVGSLAGLGLEHWILSGAGVAASATSAVGGAGLLGAAGLTSSLIGGGSDALVSHETVAQVKALYTAQQQVTASQTSLNQAQDTFQGKLKQLGDPALLKGYQALTDAQQKYGLNSKQATVAENNLNQAITGTGSIYKGSDIASFWKTVQNAQDGAATSQAQLTQLTKQYGPVAGAAELQVAKSAASVKSLFAADSETARAESANVLDQIAQLGLSYVPLVTSAAQRNLSIVNTGIRPLFTWLEGPQGIGVFDQLENAFARDLPTSIHAFDMGAEDFLRLMAVASQYTGGLSKDLDNLFTAKNQESTAQYAGEVEKLVDDLHEWTTLLKLLGQDAGGIFKQDAGTANSIVGSLTQMLSRLHDWENSTSGESQLKNIFEVHKQEIDELLQLLPGLLKGYGQFYLNVAPPIVDATTNIAKAIVSVADAVEKVPGGADLIGLAIVLGKLGILGPSLKLTATALGLLTAEEAKNVGPSAADALALTAERDAMTGGAGGVVGTGEKVAVGAGTAEAAGGAGLLSRIAPSAILARLGAKGAGVAEGLGADGLTAGAVGLGTMALGAGGVGFLGADALTHALHIGGVGSAAIKGAGTGAGIGFALGGPVTAALGGAIGAGLGAGLDEAMKLFSSHAPDYGKTFARAWIQPFQGVVTDQMGATMRAEAAKAADALNKALAPSTKIVPRGVVTVGKSPAEVQAAQAKFGAAAGATAVQGLQGIPFASTYGTSQAILETLQDLPKKAGAAGQAAAAQTMINWAQGLVAKKDLPPNAIKGIIASVELQFPALTSYLNKWGQGTSAQISTAFDLTNARGTLTQDLAGVRDDFQGASRDIAKTVTAANLFPNLESAMDFLKGQIASSTGQSRENAKAAFSGLEQDTSKLLGATVAKVAANGLALKNSVSTNTSDAYQIGSANFEKLASSIGGYMGGGATATQKGLQSITTQLNSVLKSLGGQQLSAVTVASLSPGALAAVATGQVSPGAAAEGGGNPDGGHATGGKVSSLTYMVGEEGSAHPEFVLATNPAYRSRNLGLWAEAGHHLGVRGFAKGGVPSGGISAGIAWANAVNAKHYPYEWGGGHLAIGVPNAGEGGGPAGSATGQPGFDCSGTVSGDLHAMGLLGTPMTAAQFMDYGLPGPGPVTIYASPSHTFMSLDGRFFGTHGSSGPGWYAGSALPGFVERHPPNVGAAQIGVPKVGGTGALSTVVRSGLAKVAKAANAKVTKAMLATMAGGQIGGGDDGTFTGGVAPGSWQQVAKELAAKHDWDAAQVQDWEGVEQIEDASYSLTAQNPTSDAYGLAQGITGPGWYAEYGGNSTSLVGQLTAMANYIAQRYGTPAAALAHEHSSGYYARGGKVVDYAGAFADGGVATANGPTMALFGENGPETAVFIPHYAKGGKVHSPKHSLVPAISGGRTRVTAGGLGLGSIEDLLSTMEKEHLPLGNLNVLVKQDANDPTTKGFKQVLDLLGKKLSELDLTGAMRLMGKLADTVPAHGAAGSRQAELTNSAITSVLNKVTTAFNALQTIAQNQSAIGGALQGLNPGTSLKSLGLTGGALKATGLTATQARALIGGGGYGALATLDTEQVAGYKTEQTKLEAAYKDAVKTHNTKLQKSLLTQLSAVDGAMVQTLASGQQAVIQSVLGPLDDKFSALQTLSGNQSSMASLLAGLNPGTSLASVGLTGAALKATGLSGAQAQALVGGGPASFGVQAGIDTSQAAGYQAQAQALNTAYTAAVKDHNTALQQAILQQLDTVDGAMVQAMSAAQQAIVEQITATAQTYSDQASSIGGSLSIIQAIEGLTSGDSLSGLGLSPAILQTLGIDPTTAAGLAGTSLSTYQTLATSQGGMLTSQQLSGATSGIGAQNQYLTSEETPLEQELQYYEGQLPSLTGSAQTQAISTMQGLAAQILALQSTIETNNQGLQQLTQGLAANTSATSSNTGAMTGTVSYSFNGQQYLASDTVRNLGVGS